MHAAKRHHRVVVARSKPNIKTVVDADGRVVERREGERPGQELPEEVLVELARVGRSVADHFGTPQDVEWVVADGQVVLTRARPMTALPPPPC